jgi:hypothetical protein
MKYYVRDSSMYITEPVKFATIVKSFYIMLDILYHVRYIYNTQRYLEMKAAGSF